MMMQLAAHPTTVHAADAGTRTPTSAGFGLVELIVALLILTIGLVALTGAAAVAQQSLTGSRALEEAAETAELVLDSLMREAAPLSGERRAGRTAAHWTVLDDSLAVSIHLTVTVLAGPRERRLTFTAVHHAR